MSIRSTILNFNAEVTDIDIRTHTTDSWDFRDSKHCYLPEGHNYWEFENYISFKDLIIKIQRYEIPFPLAMTFINVEK